MFALYGILVIFSITNSARSQHDVAKLLKNWSDYDKNIRPGYKGPPVHVNISMYIKDISSVSEKEMDYTIHFILRHYWNDKRLAFNETEAGTKTLVVGPEFATKIWLPDTYFVNSKEVKDQMTASSTRDLLLWFNSNGDVLYSSRFAVTASCPMDLRYFPMDDQICKLDLSSYGLTDTDAIYQWHYYKTVGIADTINLPTFDLVGARRTRHIHIGTTGNYSHLQLEFFLSRSMGFYLNQIYIPAILIVVISWVPFWLERDDSHARVALIVTTVLTMTTLITNTNESLPKISYVKAIDVFLFTCFVIVFGALLESSIAGYFESLFHQRPQKDPESSESKITRGRKYASRLDKAARLLFPLSFAVFNLIYWITYLNLSPNDPAKFTPLRPVPQIVEID